MQKGECHLKPENNKNKFHEKNPKQENNEKRHRGNINKIKKDLLLLNRNMIVNNAEYHKLCESEETYNYNKTESDTENIIVVQNSQRLEEDNKIIISNQSTSNDNNYKISHSNISKDNKIAIYIKRLEQKVRDQATRLSDAEIYRYLCEKRIKQINPDQIFPITQEHLKQNSIPISISHQLNSNSIYNKGNKQSDIIVNNKDQGNFDKKTKKENLNKIDHLSHIKCKNISDQELSKLDEIISNLVERGENYCNLSINCINEEVIELVKKLVSDYKKILCEKENEMNQVKKLKEENIALKDYFKQEKNKFKIKNGFVVDDNLTGIQNGDSDLELIRFKEEHYRKLTENYYIENEQLKVLNQELISKKDKILTNFEETITDLESMRCKIKILEQENFSLKNVVNKIDMNKDFLRRNKSCSNFNNKNLDHFNKEDDDCISNINIYTNTHSSNTINKLNNIEFFENPPNLKYKNEIKLNNNVKEGNDDEVQFLTYNRSLSKNNSFIHYSNNRPGSNLSKRINDHFINNSRNNFYGNNTNLIISSNNYLNNQILTNRLNEYKKNYEDLNSEFEQLIKLKSSLDVENAKISNELNFQYEKIAALEKQICEKDNLIGLLKYEKEIFSKEVSLLVSKINEISSYEKKEKYLADRLKDYKRLYEETNLEFTELKVSNFKRFKIQEKKIKNSMKELMEKNLQLQKLRRENKSLAGELNEIKSKMEKTSSENKIIDEDNQILEREVLFLNESNAKLQKQNEYLAQNLKQADDENLEIMRQKLFDKEKCENEINLMIKELDDYRFSVENLLKENLALKEMSKDLNTANYKNLVNQEIENLNNQISEYITREKEYQSAHVKMEKLEQENGKLISLMEEAKKTRFNLENEVAEILLQKDSLENEVRCLRENTGITDDIVIGKNKEIENLKKILSNIKLEIPEYEEKLNLQIKEKNILHEKFELIQKELLNEKESLDKLALENYKLNDALSTYKLSLNTLFSEFKHSVNKINLKANEDLDAILSYSFYQDMLKFTAFLNNYMENSFEEKKICEICKSFMNLIICELDNLYHKLAESNLYIREYDKKITFMQDKVDTREKDFSELLQNDSKMKTSLLRLQEDSTNLKMLINNLQEENKIYKNNNTLNGLNSSDQNTINNNSKNSFQTDTNNTANKNYPNFYKNKDYDVEDNYNQQKYSTVQAGNDFIKMHFFKEQANNLNDNFNTIYISKHISTIDSSHNFSNGTKVKTDDIVSQDDFKKETEFLKSQLETVTKEKENYIEFLQVLIKYYPCKNVSKLLQDLIAVKEIICVTEKEKIKIQEKIHLLEQGYKKLEKDYSPTMNDNLLHLIKTEKDNFSNLLCDYNNKIAGKTQLKKALEKEISVSLVRVREYYNNSKEKDENCKNLFNEINLLYKKLENIKLLSNQEDLDINNLLKDIFSKFFEIFTRNKNLFIIDNDLTTNANFNCNTNYFEQEFVNEHNISTPYMSRYSSIYNNNVIKTYCLRNEICNEIDSENDKHFNFPLKILPLGNRDDYEKANPLFRKDINKNQEKNISTVNSHKDYNTTINLYSPTEAKVLADFKKIQNYNPDNVELNEMVNLDPNILSKFSLENKKQVDIIYDIKNHNQNILVDSSNSLASSGNIDLAKKGFYNPSLNKNKYSSTNFESTEYNYSTSIAVKIQESNENFNNDMNGNQRFLNLNNHFINKIQPSTPTNNDKFSALENHLNFQCELKDKNFSYASSTNFIRDFYSASRKKEVDRLQKNLLNNFSQYNDHVLNFSYNEKKN